MLQKKFNSIGLNSPRQVLEMCCKNNSVRDWIHQVSKQVLEMNVLQKNSVRD
jgi:hypothetical protein